MQKDNFQGKDSLTICGVGEGDYGTQSYAVKPYSCLQVWVLGMNKFVGPNVFTLKKYKG